MRATSASTARIEEDMAAHLQELEKLPEILQQMEDLKAAQLPQAAPHGAIDRAGIKTDYTFALRHYTDGAASMYSDMKTPSAPSLQISALETTSSQLTSRFYTAPMSQTSNSDNRQTSRKCTQILVRNVGLHKTMAFQVIPHTVGTIKSMICERIGLENAEFELLYSSRVLYSSQQSIDEYGIPHDATLTCISFRPNHSPPAPIEEINAEEISWVNIKTLDDEEKIHLSVRGVTSVREVKEMWTGQKGGDLVAGGCHLIYAGRQLKDDLHLSDYGICDADILWMVYGLRTSTKADTEHSSSASIEEIFCINVKTLDDEEKIHLSLRGATLVREIKEMWTDRKGGGLVAGDCRLIYAGRQLKDDLHFYDYGICDADILWMVYGLRTSPPPASIEEILRINIKAMIGKTILSVQGNTSIREVKEMWIGQKGGRDLVASDCRLIYAGKKLRDDRHLSDYNISDADILYLVLKSRTSAKADTDRNDPNDMKSEVVENPEHRGEGEASPRTSQAKTVADKVPSFWKTRFGVPWVPKRRIYYGVHDVHRIR